MSKLLSPFVKIFKPFIMKKNIAQSSEALYQELTTQIDYKNFLTKLKLLDTFYSWYTITGLHLWMLFVRLKNVDHNNLPDINTNIDEKMCNLVKRQLTNNFSIDINNKIVKMGVKGRHKTHGLRDIWGHFQFCHFDYDFGLLGDDKDLAGSLYRTFFENSSKDDSPNHLEGLSERNGHDKESISNVDPTQRYIDLMIYIRHNIQYLDSIDLNQLIVHSNFKLKPMLNIT